jgi:predicted SnoaL-like aldol condensation-catalyzing enzyme
VPGRGDRAVLELREKAQKPGWGTNIVITMADGKIVAMQEHRGSRKARRVANVD